jgi:peptidoglycan hydrolase CwlO-like protein
MTHDSNIPQDNQKNLERLVGIKARWENTLERKTKDREAKMSRISETTGFHQAVLKDSVNDMGEEIDELEGKINWITRRIDQLKDYIEEQEAIRDGLKYKPFESLTETD